MKSRGKKNKIISQAHSNAESVNSWKGEILKRDFTKQTAHTMTRV